MASYCIIDSPIRQRNLDPDFEEADLSSNASEDSEENNQSAINEDRAGEDDESKEDLQPNYEPIQGGSNFKFAGFESDAENDDGDDEDQLVDTIEADVAQISVPPEMQFDDQLLSVLGGMERIALGKVPDAVSKELGVNGWSELETHAPYDYLQEPYEPRSTDAMQQNYPRLYRGDSGPTARALAAASTP
ncbi:hypothetical protein V7S43_012717 [Phytophthora oleae]|uniref:Uncharacterized protein n=1 Tax=Phytophthora oleae TaxID=2107226 RepID=A0ABD3F8R2_9STRA